MVDYAEEIERAGEESRRRTAMLLEELDTINRHTAQVERELAEQSAIEMRQFWDEQVPLMEQLVAEEERARAEAEEKQRLEAEALAERERLEAEAREQREAIARSIAARRANDVVTPVDEDDDPESEYYRRKSWLV